MPSINLLPWREEQRKQRQKEFSLGALAALVAGGAVMWYVSTSYQNAIDHQNRRNARLEQEIKVLKEQIEELNGLERQKERLLARMDSIDKLQRSRPEVVHLFDQMVEILPDGVFLTSVKQQGVNLEFKGSAESSTRVSALMRNIERSEWLHNPGLDVVQTVEDERTRRSEFTVSAEQVRAEEEFE